MTWLALADHNERRFSLRGIGDDRHDHRLHPDDDNYVLMRGSLVFETRVSADSKPQMLLGFDHSWPAQRNLTFRAIPGGGISLVQVRGEKIAHAALTHRLSVRTDVLRVTFSWDVEHDFAQLTLERPGTHETSSVRVNNVQPMALRDLKNLLLGHDNPTFSPDLIFAALSDCIETIGPTPSLTPNAMIRTPDGYRPAQSLQRGDLVVTRGGDTVPVLHSVSRTVPARGSFAPVRLRAPYFGLLEDVVTAPEQHLVLDGSEVEYLFNQEAVLVPARHLVNGFAARFDIKGPTQKYVQLILPQHETFLVAGTPMESLYIGRIRRHPDRLSTTLLAGLERNTLPEHGRAAFKVLKWFEAIHLARQRAA